MLKLAPQRFHKQVTPAQIREAEKNLKNMEVIIEAMTPGILLYSTSSLLLTILHSMSLKVLFTLRCV